MAQSNQGQFGRDGQRRLFFIEGEETIRRGLNGNGHGEQVHPAHDHLMQFEFAKEFHVSPFWPMDMRYDWRLTLPDDALHVHMENWRDARRAFDATLTMKREPITSATLAAALLNFPLMTAKVVAAIHWQALRLWLKRVPFYTHPDKIGDEVLKR